MNKSLAGRKRSGISNFFSPIRFSVRNACSACILALTTVALLAGTKAIDPAQSVIWKLTNANMVGNYKPVILGNPSPVKDASGASLFFNGINDGLILPKIPIEGWTRFTIEVLFKPDGTGSAAPRFVHWQDKEANRGTFEARVTPRKTWYLDTFLKNGKTSKGLTLIDSSVAHPTDQWYWAALVYDGKKMTSYVNGTKELEGETEFPAVTSGEIALGVRLNKVNWFKGLIKEVRFHPAALDPLALQQP